MSASVKLKELIDEMQCQMDEWTTYFNKKTGEFVSISDEEFRIAEEDEENSSLYDVDEDRIQIAVEILEGSDDYIELPSKYEIDEYDIMENFCLAVTNEKNKNYLLNAIRGSGAFRRFKNLIRELGLEDDWYRFKDEAYKEIAIEWCNDNEIKFEKGG